MICYVEIHIDDPPVIAYENGIDIESRMLDKILFVVNKSDKPLTLLQSALSPFL